MQIIIDIQDDTIATKIIELLNSFESDGVIIKDFKIDGQKDSNKKVFKDRDKRRNLLLDKNSMEENWEYLVKTEKDWGDGFEEMEEAISNWSKE